MCLDPAAHRVHRGDQYPQTGNRLPEDKIRVRFRDKGFARHQFQGLNVTLLEMFRQYMAPYNSNGSQLANQILGVRQNDYMSGLNDLSTAIDAFVEQAQNATADVGSFAGDHQQAETRCQCHGDE